MWCPTLRIRGKRKGVEEVEEERKIREDLKGGGKEMGNRRGVQKVDGKRRGEEEC